MTRGAKLIRNEILSTHQTFDGHFKKDCQVDLVSLFYFPSWMWLWEIRLKRIAFLIFRPCLLLSSFILTQHVTEAQATKYVIPLAQKHPNPFT